MKFILEIDCAGPDFETETNGMLVDATAIADVLVELSEHSMLKGRLGAGNMIHIRDSASQIIGHARIEP